MHAGPDKVTGVQGTQPYVVWSPTPCSDGYRITFSKSGGTIRRNVTSEYYIVRSSDVPEGSGVLSVTVCLSLFCCGMLINCCGCF